jgi:hypothetical protein
MNICRCLFILILIVCSLHAVVAKDAELFTQRSELIFNEVIVDFPSLRNINVGITFENVDEGSAETRAYPFGFYKIILDTDELTNSTDNELKGMFAHELSHIEFYYSIDWISLGIFTIGYVSSNTFKRFVERSTDMSAISHGFGNELELFRAYRLRTASATDKIILEKYYLSPEEISIYNRD